MSDTARTAGYTVVDTSTVIATHVNSILKSNSNELLGHDETQEIIDRVAEKSPKLVEELCPTNRRYCNHASFEEFTYRDDTDKRFRNHL